MSLKYVDQNGVSHVISGLTPGGDLSFGAVTTRSGTVTFNGVAANTTATVEVVFSEPMPDNIYEIIYCIESGTADGSLGKTLPITWEKTANGFKCLFYNGDTVTKTNIVFIYKAFKLYEVADAEALYSTVQDIEKAFPADASSSNKLATIRDVTSETRSLDRRIDDLEDYMPSNVSISNKVATQADLANVSIDELGDIEDVDLDDVADGQTLVWDSANSKWVNGAGGKTYTAGDGITISNTDEISAKVDDTSITTDTNDALKVADTYKTTFVGTTAAWNALSASDKAKYNLVSLTDDAYGSAGVTDAITDGDMRPVTSNAVYDGLSTKIAKSLGDMSNCRLTSSLNSSGAEGPYFDSLFDMGDYSYVVRQFLNSTIRRIYRKGSSDTQYTTLISETYEPTSIINVQSTNKSISSLAVGLTNVSFNVPARSGYVPFLAIYNGNGTNNSINVYSNPIRILSSTATTTGDYPLWNGNTTPTSNVVVYCLIVYLRKAYQL